MHLFVFMLLILSESSDSCLRKYLRTLIFPSNTKKKKKCKQDTKMLSDFPGRF